MLTATVTGMVWFSMTSQKQTFEDEQPPSVMMNAGIRSRTISVSIARQRTVQRRGLRQ